MYHDLNIGTRVSVTSENGRYATVVGYDNSDLRFPYVVAMHADESGDFELVNAGPDELEVVQPSPAEIHAGAEAITGSMIPVSTAKALAEAVLRAAYKEGDGL